MIKKKTVNRDVEEVESIICDICKKEYLKKDELDVGGSGRLEIQEFTFIRFTGGWDSVFGHSVSIGCDICQYCLKEKLGSYIREVNLLEE